MPIDRGRWDALYRDAFPEIYRALVAVLLDREIALDALQDAFHEGLRRPPVDEQNLAGWLYRVALRKARRGIFRRRSVVRLSASPVNLGDLDLTLDRLEVGHLLSLLTGRQRAIVVAYYYLGLSQEEVARMLGIRRGTVGATIARSLKRMRGEAVRDA